MRDAIPYQIESCLVTQLGVSLRRYLIRLWEMSQFVRDVHLGKDGRDQTAESARHINCRPTTLFISI